MARALIGVCIVTHNARNQLQRCVAPLLASAWRPRILVVNSSSADGTVALAHKLGCETLVVARSQFNHGLTRELARRRLGTPVVVMLTPDAWATDAAFLDRLVAPLIDGRASVAFARQLPRSDADWLERFNRRFNYPQQSTIVDATDYRRRGAGAHFCSNSACAWLASALDEIGGFPATLVSEETIAAARLLARGHRLAYVAEAMVTHSHPTSLLGDFRRLFDIGYARSRFQADLLANGADERRGRAYLRALLATTAAERPDLLPYAILDILARYAGYRIGRLAAGGPDWLARRVSGQDFYWQPPQAAPAWREAA